MVIRADSDAGARRFFLLRGHGEDLVLSLHLLALRCWPIRQDSDTRFCHGFS
jgi:hypothetical protein